MPPSFLRLGVAGPRVSIAELHPDFLEQILKRLDVEDLIRCKSVCKLWKSFISSADFIKAHLNHGYSVDYKNNGVDRRIAVARSPYTFMLCLYEFDDRVFHHRDCHLLGSSNGLVCISPFASQIAIVNPLTREVKVLKKPQIPDTKFLCCGFGYDSSTDDYKVMLGFKKHDGLTCFQILTLKSIVWKVIGDVNCSIVSRIGILCNGALHWVMKDTSIQHTKNVILSFHLPKEEFKEFPQPDDARYESGISRHPTMRLGIMEGFLCAFSYEMLSENLWMLKNYNVKQSWEMVGKDCDIKFAVHILKGLKHYIPHKRSLCPDIWFCRTLKFIGAPIFVQSLVSPDVNGRPKRKTQASNNKKSYKLVKVDPSAPGPSARV